MVIVQISTLVKIMVDVGKLFSLPLWSGLYQVTGVEAELLNVYDAITVGFPLNNNLVLMILFNGLVLDPLQYCFALDLPSSTRSAVLYL